MPNITQEVAELKSSIEALTKNIFDRIATEDMILMEDTIDVRAQQITKLISLFASAPEKPQLIAYLQRLKKIDVDIMQAMIIKREELKCALQNFGKIKNYISV